MGGYFVVPALTAAALTLTAKSARTAYFVIGVLLATAVFIASSFAAITSLAIGLAAMILVSIRTRTAIRFVVAGLCACAIGVGAVAYKPARVQLMAAVGGVSSHDLRPLNKLLSNRLVANLAAYTMFCDYPLTGVGIGCFGWQYYPYKIHVETKYPSLRRSGGSFANFGEVHNDHMQILAVSGVPGYALFLAALVMVGRATLQRRPDGGVIDGSRCALSRALGLPLALSFGVLALGQFPLELAAITTTAFFVGTAVVAWQKC